MAYQKKTVKSVLNEITSGKMYLPAIQRKYVWSESQITRLMDSILLGYPIGTFLLWKVSSKTINEKGYSLYEFIREYHEEDKSTNDRAPDPLSHAETIFAVLDGQQRLTSLYIALQGTLAMKLPWKRRNDKKAFPKKELYLNLKSKKSDVDDEITYEFAFHENANPDADVLTKNGTPWYKAKAILCYETTDDLMLNVIVPHGWNSDEVIMKNLLALHRTLVTEEIINYFEVEKESIDDVLDIFIRVNSGGTVLSKSDLLFSTIVSHWDKARDEIEDLLKTINDIGGKFCFNNDFIMRTCLYVLDFSIDLKVETFKRENVLVIKDRWADIREAIVDTVKLLDEFGFNFENMISYVAVTPMVYYRFSRGSYDNNSKDELRKYIVISQVKQIYGASSNTTLNNIREAMKKNPTSFKMSFLANLRFAGDRNLRFTQEEVKGLFELEKGAYTFMLLSLLYPHLKLSHMGFHQDHMHPYSGFSDKSLRELGLKEIQIREWQQSRNRLANLQLLEGSENESKKATQLTSWLRTGHNKENTKYLPQDVSFELKDFEQFMEKRQALMEQKLTNILI